MKRIFILLFMFSSNMLFASQDENRSFQFGILVGIQSTHFSDVFPRSVLSFKPGFIADYKLDRKWTFRTGLNYSQQSGNGEKIEQTTIQNPEGTGEYFWLVSKFHYLELLLHLNYSFQVSSMSFNISGGPIIRYLMSIYENIDSDFKWDIGKQNIIQDKVHKYDLSLGTAISTHFAILNNFDLEFGVFYSQGIIELLKDKTEGISLKTRSVGIFTVLKI